MTNVGEPRPAIKDPDIKPETLKSQSLSDLGWNMNQKGCVG